jgi:hypothetical membrane protein
MEKYTYIIGNFIENLELCFHTNGLHNAIGIFFIFLAINAGFLLLYGIFSDDFKLLRVLFQIIYIVFHISLVFLTAITLTILLGGIGVVLFCIMWFISIVWSFITMDDGSGAYIFGFGDYANTISERYYVKKQYYKDLNNNYKKFINDNKNII